MLKKIVVLLVLALIIFSVIGCEGKSYPPSIETKYIPVEDATQTQVYMNGSLLPGRDVYVGIPTSIVIAEGTSITFEDALILFMRAERKPNISGLKLGVLTTFVIRNNGYHLDYWTQED